MEQNVLKPLLRSLLFSYILSGLLLLALALALYRFRLGEEIVNAAIYAVYLIACAVGGRLAAKRLRRRFFWGLLSGLLYFLVLFAASWLMNQGAPLALERAVTVMAVCAAGGMLGGMSA